MSRPQILTVLQCRSSRMTCNSRRTTAGSNTGRQSAQRTRPADVVENAPTFHRFGLSAPASTIFWIA